MRAQRGFALVVYAVIALGVLGALGGLWWGIDDAGYDRGYARAKEECALAAQIQREAEIGRANAAAVNLEKDDAKAKVVYRTITKYVDRIVDRPVYRDTVCLDADGLRAVNAALAGESTDPAEPHGAVPAARAPGGREGGDGAAQAR